MEKDVHGAQLATQQATGSRSINRREEDEEILDLHHKFLLLAADCPESKSLACRKSCTMQFASQSKCGESKLKFTQLKT
jgi:hypothetical protein